MVVAAILKILDFRGSFLDRVFYFCFTYVAVHVDRDFILYAIVNFCFVFHPTSFGHRIIVEFIVHLVVIVVAASITMDGLAFVRHFICCEVGDVSLLPIKASKCCLVSGFDANMSRPIKHGLVAFLKTNMRTLSSF